MAAAWQASGTLLGSTGADITPVNPAHAPGDILVLMACSRDTTETLATPSGWTAEESAIDVTNWRGYTFWKRATTSSETNPLCDWSAAVGEKYGQVHNIRGAITTGNPFAGSVADGDLTDPIVTLTGVTTTLANQLVVVIALGSDNASSSVTVTATNPSSFTQRHFSTIITGADATGSFHDAVRATAGATGAVTLDHNSTMPAEYVFLGAVLDAEALFPGFQTTYKPSGIAVMEASVR